MPSRPDKQLKPAPFLKWAGGKRGILTEILPRLPKRIDHYVEPFLGGGAVFFALARANRFERATLADRNPELVGIWKIVRDEPEALMRAVVGWTQDEASYYEVRAIDPTRLSPLKRAARVLYLNKVGFNGLYRLNSKGIFNVPYGKKEGRSLFNVDNIMRCAEALQDVELRALDFEETMAYAESGATVYCDPPYWPRSKTAKFNFYDGHIFGPTEQTRLRDVFAALPERGVYGLLSNSKTPETVTLYKGLKSSTVMARRNINRVGSKRGPIEELLVQVGKR